MSYVIEFPDDLGRLVFETPGEILLWLREESVFLKGIADAVGSRGKITQAANRINSKFEDLQRKHHSNAWSAAPDELESLATLFAELTYPKSSDQAKLIRDVTNRHGPQAGAHTWLLLRGENDRPRNWDEAGVGFAYGAAFLADRDSKVQRNKLEEDLVRIRDMANQLENDVEQYRDSVKDALGAARLNIQNSQRETKEQLSAFVSSYESGMAMQAPSRYWKTKQANHAKHAEYSVIAAVLYLGLLVSSTLIWGTELLRYLNGVPVDAPDFDPKLWSVGVFMALLALLLWPVRLLAKLVATNIHLAADAHERRVMTMCLLALLRRDKAFDDELPIMLTPLFRSSSDAFVKDDGGPSTPLMEILNRLGGRNN